MIALGKRTRSILSRGIQLLVNESSAILFRYSAGDDFAALGGTFSRASSASFINEAGLVDYVASGELRDSHYTLDIPSETYVRGTLLEGQRTNLVISSQEFDSVNWIAAASSVTANAIAAPDGSITADKLSVNTANGFHSITQAPAIANATTYTGTAFVKAGELDWIALEINSKYSYFHLSGNGVVGSTAGIVSSKISAMPNGWYRAEVTITSNSTSGSFVVYVANADNGVTFAGANNTDGVYLWGVQVEAGAFASSYIPTISAAVTRAADSLIFPLDEEVQEMSVFTRSVIVSEWQQDLWITSPIILGIPQRILAYTVAGGGNFFVVCQNYFDGSHIPSSQAFTPGAAGDGLEAVNGIQENGAPFTSMSINGGTAANDFTSVAVPFGSSPSPGISPFSEGYSFGVLRDFIIAKGVKDLAYFRSKITITLPPTPVNTVEPSLDNLTPAPGDLLTLNHGTWDHNPTAFVYRWYKNTGSGFVLIPGESLVNYTTGAFPDATQISATTEAINAGGSSGEIGVIDLAVLDNPAPGNLSAPVATSNANLAYPAVGDVLTSSSGVWSGSPSYSYQWKHGSDNSNATGTGEASASYTVDASDDGDTLYCRVTATNSGGNTSRDSNESGEVGGGGLAASYLTLQFPAGADFAQSGASDYLRLYLPDDSSHVFWGHAGTSTQPALSGSPTYHQIDVDGLEADEVKDAFCQTIVNTGEWSVPGFSVQGSCANTTPPTIDDETPSDGDTLTGGGDAWTPSPTGRSFQWYADGVAIMGATAPTYTISGQAEGVEITFGVTPHNGAADGDEEISSNSATVTGAFTPATPAGLHLWLDALMGVEEAPADEAEALDGVEFWRDQSGNDFDASQATSAKRPTLVAPWSNGQPALDFDYTAGSFVGQSMGSGASGSLKPFTIFAALAFRTSGSLTIYGASGYNGIDFRINGSNKLELLKAGAVSIGQSSGTLTSNTKYLVAVTYSGAGVYKFWINGSASGTGTNDQTFDAALTAEIGTFQTGDIYDGRLAALAIYNNVLSDVDLASLFEYYNGVFALY